MARGTKTSSQLCEEKRKKQISCGKHGFVFQKNVGTQTSRCQYGDTGQGSVVADFIVGVGDNWFNGVSGRPMAVPEHKSGTSRRKN
uniref:Uncharacterized protein n=1 Tax=Caenorhabditis japonica TaxID=281687 RepID=A0A8R1IHZ8_CAEJA